MSAALRCEVAGPVGASPSAASRVTECFDCGQFHRVPVLRPGVRARCGRCDATLARGKKDSLNRTLALAVAALALYGVTVSLPFLRINLYGRTNLMLIGSGPVQLDQHGMWELAILVGLFTMGAPLLRILCLMFIIGGVKLGRAPRSSYAVLRFAERLRIWSMIEVYMLGVFVAYSKLVDLAQVELGAAAFTLGALMFVMTLMEASFDPELLWQGLERARAVANPPRIDASLRATEAADADPHGLIGCTLCRFTLQAQGGAMCPRCGNRAHPRRPNSLTRCWIFVFSAAVLYVPANLYPVLTAIRLGKGEPSTILGGVEELAKDGMYPLAILVFFASVTVPMVKLVGLIVLMLTVHFRAHGWLRDRTLLFRIIEAIGRWSMIDIFMISVLTALVRLGFVASITPGDGAIAFCAVVMLTMFASLAFDPRLMWDAALEDRR